MNKKHQDEWRIQYTVQCKSQNIFCLSKNSNYVFDLKYKQKHAITKYKYRKDAKKKIIIEVNFCLTKKDIMTTAIRTYETRDMFKFSTNIRVYKFRVYCTMSCSNCLILESL